MQHIIIYIFQIGFCDFPQVKFNLIYYSQV